MFSFAWYWWGVGYLAVGFLVVFSFQMLKPDNSPKFNIKNIFLFTIFWLPLVWAGWIMMAYRSRKGLGK